MKIKSLLMMISYNCLSAMETTHQEDTEMYLYLESKLPELNKKLDQLKVEISHISELEKSISEKKKSIKICKQIIINQDKEIAGYNEQINNGNNKDVINQIEQRIYESNNDIINYEKELFDLEKEYNKKNTSKIKEKRIEITLISTKINEYTLLKRNLIKKLNANEENGNNN